MIEATVNTEEWALRLNKELTEARTRIAALEAQIAEARIAALEAAPPAPKVTRDGVKVVGALKEGQYAVFHSAFPPHFWDGEKMVRIDLTAAQGSGQ